MGEAKSCKQVITVEAISWDLDTMEEVRSTKAAQEISIKSFNNYTACWIRDKPIPVNWKTQLNWLIKMEIKIPK